MIEHDPHSVESLLWEAARHYRRALLRSRPALDYLHSRGIADDTARRYGLGFARPTWRDLHAVLSGHGDETVLASGLLVCAGTGRAAPRFDRFRNRLMFPIRDLRGAVAGFGGRFLGDAEAHAKYLNSPESAVFRKRELLYGLYEAREALQAGAEAVMVEGYVDVLTAQQAGIAGAVGSLGTACTAAQLDTLFGHTARVVFCFDGDAAGRLAAERALRTVLPLATDAREVAFAVLPEGHDPDSLVRTQGAAALHSALRAAQPLRHALLDHLVRGCDLRWAEGRTRLAARAAAAWRALPPGRERDGLEARVRDVLQSDGPWVREYLEGLAGGAAVRRVPQWSEVRGRVHALAA